MEQKKEVTITLIRHANYGNDGNFPINKLEYVRAFFTGKAIAENFGPADAIYSSKASRATETAKVLAIATNCENVMQKESLWQDTSREDFIACLTEIREEAIEKGQKHVIIVMHLPCFWKIDIANMNNLDFTSSNSEWIAENTIKNYNRIKSKNAGHKEDFENLAKLILLLHTRREIASLLEDFQKEYILEGIKEFAKKWKRDFLDLIGIKNLNEENSWVEILSHPKCEEINILGKLNTCFDTSGAFSFPRSAWIHNFLPGYEETKALFCDRNLQFGEYFSLMEQPRTPNIHYAKIAMNYGCEFFEANPIVSSKYAEKMKGIDILLLLPLLGRVSCFSFATKKSERFLKAVEDYKDRLEKRQDISDDLPF